LQLHSCRRCGDNRGRDNVRAMRNSSLAPLWVIVLITIAGLVLVTALYLLIGSGAQPV